MICIVYLLNENMAQFCRISRLNNCKNCNRAIQHDFTSKQLTITVIKMSLCIHDCRSLQFHFTLIFAVVSLTKGSLGGGSERLWSVVCLGKKSLKINFQKVPQYLMKNRERVFVVHSKDRRREIWKIDGSCSNSSITMPTWMSKWER